MAILMATYNGARYLEEQLSSIQAQTYPHWSLWVSDDGSKDATWSVLKQFHANITSQPISLMTGPKQGFLRNFLSLVCNPQIEADYYAFSDQDDSWEADKLARAAAWLSQVPADVPALYCSRTSLVDENNQAIGLSPLFAKPPGFQNALVQSLAGGNTMVFNQAARELLVKAGWELSVISHDWWVYLLVTGCGGRVCYDPQPSLRYRQHTSNLIGMNRGLKAKVVRIKKMFQGHFKAWNNANIAALLPLRQLLTAENQRIFDRFVAARQGFWWKRLYYLLASGVFRQTRSGQLALWLASLCNKV